MNGPSPLALAPIQSPPLTLRERLQLVPPARIIAAVEDSGDVLTLGDLRQFAKYLAEEFVFDVDEAAGYPALWYAQQIEWCTPAQAETVRTMTIELCGERTLYRGYDQSLLAGGTQRAEALDAFGAAMVILLLLVLVPLLFGDYDVQTSVHDQDPSVHAISAPVIR